MSNMQYHQGVSVFTKIIMALFSLIWINPVWSFNCYFTLAKASCWTKYHVNVDVIDAANKNVLTTVDLPAGKGWVRQEFACEPSQKLLYQARFSPPIWDSEKGKVYSASKFLFLPDVIKPGEKAWVISACYPGDFSDIPLPPDATSNCACDFSSIPAVKPQ